jgi:hypothetical protein
VNVPVTKSYLPAAELTVKNTSDVERYFELSQTKKEVDSLEAIKAKNRFHIFINFKFF